MAYEPYEWKAKDNITTARLNHIEQGIAAGGGAMVVSMDLDSESTSVTFPMTWKEVNDTITSGTIVIFKINSSDNNTSTSIVTTFRSGGGKYKLYVAGFESATFSATSENDYPVWDGDDR